MSDIITLADGLGEDGVYRLHLMSNEPIEREPPPGADVTRSVEAGTCVLRAEWRYRGPCQIICETYDWRRVVVLWGLERGDRISEGAVEAARMYYDVFMAWPETAWLHKMPSGAAHGTMIRLPFEADDLSNEMVVVDADFVPAGFLAVGRAGIQPAPLSDPPNTLGFDTPLRPLSGTSGTQPAGVFGGRE